MLFGPQEKKRKKRGENPTKRRLRLSEGLGRRYTATSYLSAELDVEKRDKEGKKKRKGTKVGGGRDPYGRRSHLASCFPCLGLSLSLWKGARGKRRRGRGLACSDLDLCLGAAPSLEKRGKKREITMPPAPRSRASPAQSRLRIAYLGPSRPRRTKKRGDKEEKQQ